MKMWERKGIRPRQPHRRSNRTGMKIDSGIRNGEYVLKGPPRVWTITQPPPPVIPLPFGDVTVKCSVPSVG